MKRIALDTGVARELCHNEPTWYPTFAKMVCDGWSFHLTDISVGEIIAARERNAIKEKEWAQAVLRLNQILTSEFPCLPGQRDLFHLCGFRDDNDPNTNINSECFLRAYSLAIWDTLQQPLLQTNTVAKVVKFTVGNQTFTCPIKPGNAYRLLEDERTKWINEMSRKPQNDFKYLTKVAKIKCGFDKWAKTSGLPMSIRGDIIAHVQAEWERRLANKYTASSNNNRNDGIDFLLLFTFMWPALLVTTDCKFRNLIRSLKDSFQSTWIFHPNELAQAWINKTLIIPSWPAKNLG